MKDLDFCVILTVTLMSTYYHRHSLNEEYLRRYNDDFPHGKKLGKQLQQTFAFIEECSFDKKCRVWKKTDLFTLIVELYSLLSKNVPLDAKKVGAKLTGFYAEVNKMFKMEDADEELAKKSRDVFRYLKAATKATNDKYARVDRGEVIEAILQSTLATKARKDSPKRTTKKTS